MRSGKLTMPVTPLKKELSRGLILVGLLLFVFSSLMALRGSEPFATWFFCFAWWSYIFLIDGWVYKQRGESLLLNHTRRFVFLAFWSIVFWLIFEALNLRLGNWTYHNLPSSLPLRWIGYCLSFATVVPALFETADLLDASGFVGQGRIKPMGWKKRVEPVLIGLGVLMLALPLLWPKLFFPLVWVAFIFLLDPINEQREAPSLLLDWRKGRLRRIYILLFSGVVCGGLWELWNSWSLAGWSYSIPWVGHWQLFEMPILGYLGFPPFAMEAFVMTSFVLCFWEKSSLLMKTCVGFVGLGFILGMCWCIDHFSVDSFQTLPPL